MLPYTARRLLYAIAVVLAATLLVFVLMRLTGDPALLLLPSDAPPEEFARLRHDLGLDQPMWLQFSRFLGHAIHGDFGRSHRNNLPAMPLVLERMPATLRLAAAAFAFSLVISVPIGIASATRRDSAIDALGRALALLGQAVPSFWLGIMLILVFSVKLRLLPAFGGGTPYHLILPGVTLGAYSAAITSRLLRSAMLEALRADYIRTARAKGLSERVVLYKHALRNAALPVLTVLGLQVGVLVGGAVVTEFVFSYPGMGRLVLQAIAYRDFSVVQSFVILISLLISVANLLIDILYGVLDPRVQYR